MKNCRNVGAKNFPVSSNLHCGWLNGKSIDKQVREKVKNSKTHGGSQKNRRISSTTLSTNVVSLIGLYLQYLKNTSYVGSSECEMILIQINNK